MMCDQRALQRHLVEGTARDARPVDTVAGVHVGCFPGLYAALSSDRPDYVISL